MKNVDDGPIRNRILEAKRKVNKENVVIITIQDFFITKEHRPTYWKESRGSILEIVF